MRWRKKKERKRDRECKALYINTIKSYINYQLNRYLDSL